MLFLLLRLACAIVVHRTGEGCHHAFTLVVLLLMVALEALPNLSIGMFHCFFEDLIPLVWSERLWGAGALFQLIMIVDAKNSLCRC